MRMGALLLLAAASASAAVPYFGTDLGNPNLKGSFVDNGDGTLNIIGGGSDIWGTSDTGYYYYTWATGQNWDAKVQVTTIGGPDAWTKCEFMVRQADPANGPVGNDAFMAACLARDNNLSFQGRPQRGADAINPGTGATRTDPQWLRIIREGAKFTVMVSIDNQATWVTNRVVDTAAGNDGFSTWPDLITIGIAVTAHNNDDLGGGFGTVSPITGNFGTIVFPTAIGATTQPQSQAVLLQSQATFNYVTTNNAQPSIPSLPIVSYQWYMNGNVITGATSTVFTILASQADNGAQIYCKATVNPPFNASLAGLTSDTATLTVNPSTEYSGLKSEFFRNATRAAVTSGSVPKANWLSRLPGLDDPGGYGDNYVNRVSGWWTPTVSGNYVFYVAADDDTDVYLSSDATPANKKLIAQEANWNGTRAWTNDPGNRSSATFLDSEGQMPWASGIPLTAGNKYYIEAVHHNGGGGDNLGVTYRLTTETEWTNWTTNGAPSRLTNGLTFYTWPATTLTWAYEPTNTAVFDLSGMTMRARATTDSELAPRYQWYRNGTNIPNATGESYTINPVVFANNNNDTFFVVANTDVGGIFITSRVATLTVLQTVFEPGFAKVEMYRGVTDRNRVINGTAGDPTFVTTVPMLGAGTTASWGSDYTRRLSAYFIPPTTGAYDFFLASDDDGDLFLSTDAQPANKRIIATETGWSGVGQWVEPGTGGSVWHQKRSDQYTNTASAGLPVNPNGIQLTAGNRYYTEIVMHQGGGGDNVEAYWKLHSATGPVNGAADNFVGNVIGAPVPRCSYVAFTNQPASQTATVMTAVTFTANGVTDSTTPIGGNGAPVTNNFMFFQWYKNGVAIPGANLSTYRIDPVLATDDGAQIYCKMRALGYQDNAGTQLWSNSAIATLTVSKSVFEPGWSQYSVWNGKLRVDVNNGNVGAPNATTYITDWANAGGLGDNYTRRFMGYYIPPTSDNYTLFLSADDDTDLFLSTDDTVANKRLVAQQIGWGNATLAWQTLGGGGDTLATRRTDQFINPATGVADNAAGIPLVAGRKYYIETVHHNGGGGDYCSVTAVTKSQVDNNGSPLNNDPTTLTGANIGTYVPQCSYMLITEQPQDVTVTNLLPATFRVAATSDSIIRPGGNPVMMYQWYKNGTPIAGATRATLTIPAVDASDNGAQIVCAVRSLGYGDALGNRAWSNSTPATLNVISAPPTFVHAGIYTNMTIDSAAAPIVLVTLTFNKKMDVASLANSARYTINGGLTIAEVLVNSNDFRHVALRVTGTPVHPITVSFNGLTDANGNPLAPGTSSPVAPVPLQFLDIGLGWGADPAFPSTLWTDGARDYTVVCQGSDIWGNLDGFNFLYEAKTGDFDVVVRQKSITHSSQWAKGGLMVRETLDAASRNWNIVNTPLASDGIMAPDNSGYGSSAIECNARNATALASVGWDFARGAQAAYPNAWLRLTRTGQLLSAYFSTNGVIWTLAATNNPTLVGDMLPLPATVYVGICSTAHNNDTLDADPRKYYNTAEYADYNSAYVPASVVTLTSKVVGNNLQISWTPNVGKLVSTPTLGTGAAWTAEAAGNPVLIPITGGAKFFKVIP